MPKRKLSILFENAPYRWGLRGDPYLWQEMATLLAQEDIPAEPEMLASLVANAYARLVGKSLTDDESHYVERLEHGGMSSGHVSPEFWRNTAIPLLLERLRQLRTDLPHLSDEMIEDKSRFS